jgi:ArsR family transcriptional regulator
MAKQAAMVQVIEAVCCPSVLAAPLDADEAADMASGFSALADPARLRILSILAAAPDGEVCVCDFVGPVGKSQPTISHHLKSSVRPGWCTATVAGSGCGTRSIGSGWQACAPHSVPRRA